MKSVKLVLCVLIVLLAACSSDNEDEKMEVRSSSLAVKNLWGTWIADSLRFTEDSEKSEWSNWINTEPDTIVFSLDRAYFGFTDRDEVSGTYNYSGDNEQILSDQLGLTWKVRSDGKLFLQFDSPKEIDQYLYRKIE